MIDEKTTAVKASIAVAGVTIYGVTLDFVIGVLTVIYLLLLIGLLVPKYFGMYRAWRKRKNEDVDSK
ncbi:MAG: hypothetical protein LBI35_09630 [Burkholderiales bacterium]|jgi:hypothetical protein|nr:hypothetical protein [Burkholderiales bacterium]